MIVNFPSAPAKQQSDALTPREIVAELDKHVIGQKQAKRAVAIALRNRMRRQKLPPEMAEEVMPKNILMIGPTGVGKTEIARRLAKWRTRPSSRSRPPSSPKSATWAATSSRWSATSSRSRSTWCATREQVEVRAKRSRMPRSGCSTCCCRRVRWRLMKIRRTLARRRAHSRADARTVARGPVRRPRWSKSTCAKKAFPSLEIINGAEHRRDGLQLQGHDAGLVPGPIEEEARAGPRSDPTRWRRKKSRSSSTWIRSTRVAVDRVEQAGIIFLDEIDKIAGRESGAWSRCQPRRRAARHPAHRRRHHGQHQHGIVRTDHILFIAAGAFHVSKPSRSHSGAPGTVSHPGRAEAARSGRVRPDSDRAAQRAGQAIHGPDGHRRRDAGVFRRRGSARADSPPSSMSAPRTSALGDCIR